MSYKAAIKAIEILEEAGFEAMLAGGCVRDRLLGVEPKDYDIATNALVAQMCSIFKQKRVKTIPTGVDHGTITVLIMGQTIEITTLREDVKTDGRHAVVSFDGATFESDAKRRDFTINSLFESKDGQILDFYGGVGDLKNKILRFVGDPAQRIKEDYLRIMRFFRFWARFELTPSEDCFKAISENVSGLKKVSQERITAELVNTLKYKSILDPFELMLQTGVFKIIFPELSPIPLRTAINLIDKTQTLNEEFRFIARLSSLVDVSPLKLHKKEIKELGDRLKLPNIDIQRLVHITCDYERISSFTRRSEIMEFIDYSESKCGQNSFLNLVIPIWEIILGTFAVQELKNTEINFGDLRRQKPPISGEDLIHRLGMKEGRDLGKLINALKQSFRDGEWSTKEEGFRWISAKFYY